MTVSTWFNVYVFDRWPWLERKRQWCDIYLLREMEWRLRYLTTGQTTVGSKGATTQGIPLKLIQPHSLL